MSRNAPFVVAIDQGTTSSRAMIFDAQGCVVSSAQREFEQIFPRSGWVEHRPRDILTSVQVTLTEAMHKAGIEASAVAGIGITNQRETTVVWDRASGEPVYNALVWQSRHSTELCEAMRSDAVDELVRQRTGLLLDAYFSATKLKWLFDHVDGVRERAQRGELLFGTVDSWLVWNLTGGRVHVTDVTNASRTLLYDIHRRCWDDDLLALFGVPASMLPQVRGCSEIYGHIEPKYFFGRDVPICGIAGDQQAALFGQACYRPGAGKCTFGTGSFVLTNTGDTPVRSAAGLLTTVAWDLGDGPVYALEGAVFVTGAAVQWLRDGLGLIGSADQVEGLAGSVVDTGGVVFVPALTGLGAPDWDPRARGTIVGISRGTSGAHLARATLEAIAFEVRDVVDAMTGQTGTDLPALCVDGGASANDLLCQLQADQLAAPVRRPTVTETTALGAAFLAGLGTGVWSSTDELARTWRLDRQFEPTAGARDDGRHVRWRRAVERARDWD
ncbi:MAG TPA: glycerol kinase GlpK [Mycobacterium sp.]|nr:glycerol kinase GlpK [Mycobacterium sp.]